MSSRLKPISPEKQTVQDFKTIIGWVKDAQENIGSHQVIGVEDICTQTLGEVVSHIDAQAERIKELEAENKNMKCVMAEVCNSRSLSNDWVVPQVIIEKLWKFIGWA